MVDSTDFQAVFYQKTVAPPWYERNHWEYQAVVSKFKISAGTFFDKMKIIQKIIHRTIKITIKSYIKKENGMNQKRNRLFAIALCGSLLISSLNGIPAVAETINAPNITQEKPQEEPQEEPQADAPPESSESGAALRGLPVTPPITTTAAEVQPEEPPAAEVSENFQLDQPVPLMPDLQQGSKRENRAAGTFAIPAKTYKLAFIDEAGNYIDPAKVTITGEAMKVEAQGTSGKVGDVVTSNVGNLKEMTVPTVTLADDDSTGNTGYSGVRNSQIRLPGYYDLPQMSPTTYYTGTTFPIAQSKRVRLTNNEVTETDESGTRFRLLRTTPKQYEFTDRKSVV